MFYFVPAWYASEHPWHSSLPYWFRIYQKMEFDDTVNQIKIFQHAGENTSLMILNYNPQLRYTLHNQALNGTPYWSFFDDIQNISLRETSPLSFKELNWPEGVEFIYTPFVVLVRWHKQVLAQVHFAESGNLLLIDYYQDDLLDRTYYFDDRGFLSSIIFHDEQGQALYQEYLNQNGVWQVREDLRPDHGGIMVNPYADKAFKQAFYLNWEELLQERLLIWRDSLAQEDSFVIATHELHNRLLNDLFAQHKKVFSFFGDRYDIEHATDFPLVVEDSNLLVADKSSTEELVRQTMLKNLLPYRSLLKISPFDTRLRLGHSQNVKELTIYFFIDTITEDKYWEIMLILLDQMMENPLIELVVGSYDTGKNFKSYAETVDQHIKDHLDISAFFDTVADSGENQIDESTEMENTRIAFKTFTNETDIIKAMDTVRLVIDLGEEPDLFTQIASISAGIPQINQEANEYVAHRRNGWLLAQENDLVKALHFYFDTLANWNQSLVYAIDKMSDYTSGRLLARWKEELEKHE